MPNTPDEPTLTALEQAAEAFAQRCPTYAATRALDDLRRAEYARLERQVHTIVNHAMGVFHMGQRHLIWVRISVSWYPDGGGGPHYA